MGVRKIQADHIFNGTEMLTGKTLVVADDGTISDVVNTDQTSNNGENYEGIICPGFINAHCHLELSHMKGVIPKMTGLVDFVYNVMTGRHVEKEVMLSAIADAEQQMFNNGIVAVGDICNNPITVIQKLRKNLYYHNFIEASGLIPSVVPERFRRSVNLYNLFAELSAEPQATTSITPHAPYSVSEELFTNIASFPGNGLLTMHNQETEDENELYQTASGNLLQLYQKLNIDARSFKARGKSSLQSTLPYFYSQQSLILVHNVATSEDDLAWIKENETPALHWCLCPNANQYISGTLPPVDLLREARCNIILGTDSLASNDELSILSEIKTLKNHFPHLQLKELLQWATSNGAAALNISDRFGSFEKGKKPGVILIGNKLDTVRRLL